MTVGAGLELLILRLDMENSGRDDEAGALLVPTSFLF